MKLIDKDALLSDIERTIEESGCVNHEGEIMDCIRYASEVDAVPVVRGEWIENPTKDSVLCSYCHADWNLFDNDTYRFCYCPNCGAKMEDKP